MLNRSKIAIRKALGLEFSLLERMLVEFENPGEMHKWFDWSREPRLEGARFRDLLLDPAGDPFENASGDVPGSPVFCEEVNLRVVHDAEVVWGLAANLAAARIYEIGHGLLGGLAGDVVCDESENHDAESVFDETRAALTAAEPGDYILWHDFNLALANSHHYIYQVCVGLEELYRSELLQGKVYHLRDSWVGIYCVPGAD